MKIKKETLWGIVTCRDGPTWGSKLLPPVSCVNIPSRAYDDDPWQGFLVTLFVQVAHALDTGGGAPRTASSSSHHTFCHPPHCPIHTAYSPLALIGCLWQHSLLLSPSRFVHSCNNNLSRLHRLRRQCLTRRRRNEGRHAGASLNVLPRPPGRTHGFVASLSSCESEGETR